MNAFANTSAVKTQYATASHLNTRISIHETYAVNKLSSHMVQGVLTVPKEYGLFLCQ